MGSPFNSSGGWNAVRAVLLVSSQKWLPLRNRPYRRAAQLLPNWRAVPIMYSSMRRGVMSSTNNLPDDDAFGAEEMKIPLASKRASIVVARFRSHDAARGSELAAGLYRAKLP